MIADVRKMVCDTEYVPKNAQELCSRLLFTCYMGTQNSSVETRQRAKTLATQIGRYCKNLNYLCIFKYYLKNTKNQYKGYVRLIFGLDCIDLKRKQFHKCMIEKKAVFNGSMTFLDHGIFMKSIYRS